MPGYSISIFLPDGKPDGLRIARRSHWTGEVVMCPRNLYAVASQRPEFDRTGTYVLLGGSTEGLDGAHVYVGETDCIRDRMKSHYGGKDFWDALVFVSKSDGSLHKADVRYLESELLARAHQAPTTTVENSKASGPPTPIEAHKADLDTFLEDTLAIFRVLGVTAFARRDDTKPSDASPDTDPAPPPATRSSAYGDYRFQVGTAYGRMTVEPEGFLLRAGDGVAEADKEGLGPGYRALRKKLRDTGSLVPIDGNPDHMRLEADLLLPSATTAAVVVYGSNISGPQKWKDAQGRTLAEREQEAVEVSDEST